MDKKNTNIKFHFPAKNEKDLGNEHDEIASDYRGKIIHYVTELEDRMNAVIVEYFIKDNFTTRLEFEHVIITEERFSLSFKFGIISYLVKHPFKSFGESNTHFLTVLDSLIGMRNKYAHYGFINKSPRHHNTTPPLRLNKLSHTTRATKTDFVFLNEKDLKEFYGDCFAVKKCLKELWNLIVESNKKKE